ncbi:flavin reductase [Streptomyces tendae]|uniref:flavin reductase n=1 Tax=Streptomyces tendae TaxID=1932 RepID=UPI00367D592C
MTAERVPVVGDLATQFREGMAHLGAGVCVITSNGPAGLLGFTATAVSSVTDAPPTLLVCMNRVSTQNAALKRNGVLCVNVLAGEHADLSSLFAGATQDMAERFAAATWTYGTLGVPRLASAVASFDCRVAQSQEVGTHSVLFGQVADVEITDEEEALIYLSRAYHRVRRLGHNRGGIMAS